MSLALVGFGMVISFILLIMTKRVTALVALILLPLLFALALGVGPQSGEMMMAGLRQVAPTAVLLVFAILYFGIMIDAGLFQPLVHRIVNWVGDDPVRVTLGHAALVTIISIDGDGTTTVLVTVSALYPVYRRLGMSPLVFLTVGGLCFPLMNFSPWAGPSARIAAALNVTPLELYIPLMPSIVITLMACFSVAWWLGLKERKRLKWEAAGASAQEIAPVDDRQIAAAFQSTPESHRPRLVWVNLALTLLLMAAVVLHLAPAQPVFMIGTAIALLVNYPRLSDQRERVLSHAGSILNVAVLVLAAGAFTGILSGTGMVQAMADQLVAILPPALGPNLGPVSAFLALPGTFFLSNEAFYFGILPVIAEAGRTYGVDPAEIGRAAMLGGLLHGLSPLVPAVYLKCALVNVELADLQRFAFKYAIAVSMVLIAAAVATGAVPLRL